MKIFISPSNQPSNRYITGGISEKQNCEAISKMVKAEMDQYETVTRLAGFSTWYGDRPTEAKNFGAKLYICIHTNAGGGGKSTGAVVFYNNSRTQAIAIKLVDALNAIAPVKSNRSSSIANKVGSLAEMTLPNKHGMDVLYIEVNFHDNPDVAPWLISAKAIISKTISDVIMKSYSLKLKNQDKGYFALGDTGDGVRKLQTDMARIGFSTPGGIDGSYGPGTQASVKSFQINYGLTVDGIAGPQTLSKIDQLVTQRIALEKAQKAAEAEEAARKAAEAEALKDKVIAPDGKYYRVISQFGVFKVKEGADETKKAVEELFKAKGIQVNGQDPIIKIILD